MENVLLVDDEQNVLSGYRRSLRGRFLVDTASSGPEALEKIKANGPYPVIVSDMRMPGMNGVELFCKVKAHHPHTVRVLLTGNSDQTTAVQAINQGDVFRFLTKPCPPEILGATLTTALDHHRLLKVEKDLLANTLKGTVEVLVELLSLVRPEVLGQTMRLRELLRAMNLAALPGVEPWSLHTAVLLSQLGYTTLSSKVVERIQNGAPFLEGERAQVSKAVELSARLVGKIPRLDKVAEIIRYQEKCFNGSGGPSDRVSGEEIPAGARTLKVLLDFDRLLAQGISRTDAVLRMQRKAERYDPKVLEVLAAQVDSSGQGEIRSVPVHALNAKMVLVEDVSTQSGVLLIPKGMRATDSVQAHLKRFHDSGQIGEMIDVRVVE